MPNLVKNDDVLAIAMRPRRFSEIIGQDRQIKQIRHQIATGRKPRAWLFYGQAGGGKTTTARIVALALQESAKDHPFGDLLDSTIADASSFSIFETNASEQNGVEEIGLLANHSSFVPTPGSKQRVYILDEAHRLSNAAQNLLLKYLEDGPKTTTWIVCSSEPGKLIVALRRRCTVQCRFDGLETADITKLALRAKKYVGYEGKVGPFVAKMDQLGINSPGLILNAFEAYISGGTKPVTGSDDKVDPIRICRLFLAGDWRALSGALKETPNEQARDLQMVLLGYLKSVLLGGGGNSNEVAATILDLGRSPVFEGSPLMAWLAATLHSHIRKIR